MSDLSVARRDFSRIGISMFLMILLTWVLIQALGAVIAYFFGEAALLIPWVALSVSGAVQYLIAMPIAYLMIRGLKKQDTPAFSINFGKFLIFFLISYFLMYAGNLLGLGSTALIQHFADGTLEPLFDDFLIGNNIYIYMSFVVILAPIIEELFFRKLLITRIERYGEAPAIIVSGLIFGIFHGNLNQGFYAVALGFVLGYIYIRTRKIIITIGLHMLINLFGGVALPLAASDPVWLTLAGMAALGFAISGLVMFIIRIRKVSIVQREDQLPSPGWGRFAFANTGMIFFFAGGAATIVINTLSMLVQN